MFASSFAASLAPQVIRILFLGNSHTAVNDVPGMVRQFLEQGGTVKVTVQLQSGGHLEDMAKSHSVRQLVADTKWDHVVLQGAMVSSSHKFTYKQDGAIDLAKTAKKAGAKVWLYAEWPRRGWDETEYTVNVYRGIAANSGATVVPVGRAWDKALRLNPKLDLWAADGNHAALAGSALAARMLAGAIRPGLKFGSWPKGIGSKDAAVLERVASS